MKYILLLPLCMIMALGQTYGQLTLGYVPEKPTGWDEQKYHEGIFKLEGAYTQLEENGGEPNYADYWNVAVAYFDMGQPVAVVQELLESSYATNPVPFCELVGYLNDMGTRFADTEGLDWEGFVRNCEALPQAEEEVFDLEAYAHEGGYEIGLLRQLDTLMERDQRYRQHGDYSEHSDWVALQQEQLDPENLRLIGGLILELGEYPGEDMVGPKFAHVACLVIEHAAPADMAYAKKLLPMVAEAYQQKQLKPGMLRMLIDRLHWLEHGTQIYGSHQGIPFAESTVREAVKGEWLLP